MCWVSAFETRSEILVTAEYVNTRLPAFGPDLFDLFKNSLGRHPEHWFVPAPAWIDKGKSMGLYEVPQSADLAFTSKRPIPVKTFDLPVSDSEKKRVGR